MYVDGVAELVVGLEVVLIGGEDDGEDLEETGELEAVGAEVLGREVY